MENHDTAQAEVNASDTTLRSFLALVPRGLEHAISRVVTDQVSDARLSLVGGGDRPSGEIGSEARDALLAHQQKKQRPPNPWFVDGAVGSVEVSKSKHISVGYSDKEKCTWSIPGTLEGTVWMKIETKQTARISSLRCLGPILSLITTSDSMSSLSNPKHSMSDIMAEFSRWLSSIGSESYHQRLEASLDLWKTYIGLLWEKMLNQDDFKALQDRIQANKLRFRLSCMRDHVDASYSRQDFLAELMDKVGPTLLPSYNESSSDDGWTVNLKHFEVEFVVLLLSNGFMAMGISLLPYSFYNAKSFGTSGIPPDISTPYLGHEDLDGIVRLRPTTAHVLLHMARVQPFEMVLDPCAGIGTIPIEAEVFFPRCLGLGGDVVLGHPTIASAASSMEQEARKTSQAPSSLLTAWDAAHLPLRTCSVDVCISDLPFGKQCLSSNLLKQLLPLIFLECARVLFPSSGRMLMLCGSPTITESLTDSERYWKQPCTIAMPVTIGGLRAWIFRIERNEVVYDPGSHPRILPKVRSLARRRDMIARHEKGQEKGGNGKKRRIQR